MQENKLTIRGELSLLLVIIINSLGVVLMLHSGSGISAISSVPYAFADVLPVITLGAWTEVFQVSLVLSLMLLSKRFVPVYLFSFCYLLWRGACQPLPAANYTNRPFSARACRHYRLELCAH